MSFEKYSDGLHPHIFSFFSGSGFLDLGFESEGYEIVFVNELFTPFLDAYKFSRQNMGRGQPKYGYYNCSIEDFLNHEEKSLAIAVEGSRKDKKLIGFIGGPPCPDFSVGGKNRGIKGENGKLSQSYIDVICRHLPDFFVFENVKGLYRTAKHREFFSNIKEQLHRSGYSCTERLINAIEYGAPQDRERIILFGVRNGQLKKKIEYFDWMTATVYPNRSAFDFPWPKSGEEGSDSPPTAVPLELTVQYWFDKNDVGRHPNASHHFRPKAGLKKFMTLLEGDDSKKSYKRLHRWRYSPTAAYGNNEVHIHPYLPRRISVSEALAIQSLPKAFELPSSMTLTNMFKTVGNGVPFLAAKGIAKSIMVFLRENNPCK